MTTPLTVALVDDEPLAIEYLSELVGAIPDVSIANTYRNGREALEGLKNNPVDLLFLDIQMPGLDGFEVVKRLQADTMPLVVFATAYDEFALQAFEYNAVDYILKPFEAERVAQAVDRVRERVALQRASSEAASAATGDKGRVIGAVAAIQGESTESNQFLRSSDVGRLAVKDGRKTELVEFATIDWIDAAGDYMCVHAAGETHIVRSTMKELEQRLNENFVRIHRSTIVNLAMIRSVDALPKGEASLNLSCGAKLKVSRNYRTAIQHLLS
ncbi:MAG: LytTR family DNA-binding domain-containing protein [Halieaceae bacterium]|jgi:two-component system LytT family response regulator|nr:LytTR family DNA-binding domain-containing protein [Halieaceae bacterium]